jgi:hypothetical protein
MRRLEQWQRRRECFDPAEMSAVGAGAHRELGMSVEEKGRAFVLYRRRERLDVVDPRALVAIRQTQQHGGNVGCSERFGESLREPRSIVRGHQVKARSRTPRFGRSFSGRHEY